MAISKQTKERLVTEYSEKLSASEATIWTGYQGLTVSEINDLRNRLREKGAEFHVIKNSLIRRALQGIGYPIPDEHLDGPTAICFCGQDIAGAAQMLVDARRTHAALSIRGGLTKTVILGGEGVTRLASLPSREILLGQVLGTIQSPMRGLVTVLNGSLRGLLTVLKARADQLGSEA